MKSTRSNLRAEKVVSQVRALSKDRALTLSFLFRRRCEDGKEIKGHICCQLLKYVVKSTWLISKTDTSTSSGIRKVAYGFIQRNVNSVPRCSSKKWHCFGVDRATVKSGEQEKVECPRCGCKMSIEANQMNCGNT